MPRAGGRGTGDLGSWVTLPIPRGEPEASAPPNHRQKTPAPTPGHSRANHTDLELILLPRRVALVGHFNTHLAGVVGAGSRRGSPGASPRHGCEEEML